MFTGIVESVGTIESIQRKAKAVRLAISPNVHPFTVELGGSVSVDGVCLTVEERSEHLMYFTAVAETLSRTTLADAAAGTRVNLERAMPVSGRLDGHLVLGHVDALGTILNDRPVGESVVRTFEVPGELHRLLAPKGSVAVDGVSLTIVDSASGRVSVSLVPFTHNKTTMSLKRVGDSVNIECDVLARYIFHMLQQHGGADHPTRAGSSLQALLENSGF